MKIAESFSLIDKRRIKHKLRQFMRDFIKINCHYKRQGRGIAAFTEECLRHSSRRYYDYSQNVEDELGDRREGCVLIMTALFFISFFSH